MEICTKRQLRMAQGSARALMQLATGEVHDLDLLRGFAGSSDQARFLNLALVGTRSAAGINHRSVDSGSLFQPFASRHRQTSWFTSTLSAASIHGLWALYYHMIRSHAHQHDKGHDSAVLNVSHSISQHPHLHVLPKPPGVASCHCTHTLHPQRSSTSSTPRKNICSVTSRPQRLPHTTPSARAKP